MSSFNRRAFILCAAALTGCGFTPAYGPSGAGTVLRNTVEVAPPQDRETYNFAEAVETRLGSTENPRYRLSYTIETDESAVGLTRAQEINRYHVTGTATYTLVDIASGATVASGQVSSFTAYASTGSTVASLATTRDAYSRLMQILADRTVNDLIIAVSNAT